MLHKNTAMLFHSRFIVCHQAATAPYRGRSPAAPLLVPAADTDDAQAVPTPTVVVHRQRRC